MPQENGVVTGIVADLDDPEALGRVRVKFPHLNGELSDWSRLAAPLGGKGTGWFLRPNVGDEVLVLWEHGDARRCYVVGSLWSKAEPPPPDDGKKVENNWRFFKSRSGHVLKFDDTSGKERIEIIGKGERHKLVVDVSGSKIEISCSSGDIAISAPAGKLSLEGSQVEIKAASTMSVQAGGTLTLKGATVNIN